MTVRDFDDVIGRYRYKLCDHPESYFVKVFRRGLMEELRQNVSNSFSSLKAIKAAAIIEEDRMGLPVIPEGAVVAVPRQAAESATKGSEAPHAVVKDPKIDKLIGSMNKLQLVLAQSLVASVRPKGPVRCCTCNERGTSSTRDAGDLRLTLLPEHHGLPAFISPTCR